MNNRLYSHLYLHLENIFTLKKSSAFANLLMEKPGNRFVIAKIVRITSEEEERHYKIIT